jgi:hypothetical protein
MFNCLTNKSSREKFRKLWVEWKTFRHTLIFKKISAWKEKKEKKGEKFERIDHLCYASDLSWRIDGDVRQW